MVSHENCRRAGQQFLGNKERPEKKSHPRKGGRGWDGPAQPVKRMKEGGCQWKKTMVKITQTLEVVMFMGGRRAEKIMDSLNTCGKRMNAR